MLIGLVALWTVGVFAETPKEGAAAILQLVTDRNYSVLFQQRYCEWYKVEAEGVEPEKAINKLSSMWEKNHEMMVQLYKQLANADFELSKNEKPQETETGDVATATVLIGEKKVPYSLYKMKSGRWGFHL